MARESERERDVARPVPLRWVPEVAWFVLTHTRDLSSDVVSGMVCGVIQAQCAG